MVLLKCQYIFWGENEFRGDFVILFEIQKKDLTK